MDEETNTITRRDFLKLLGTGVTVSLGGMLFGKMASSLDLLAQSNNSGLAKQAYAQDLGSWSLGVNMPTTPIHAASLPNGKILYLTGSDFSPSQQSGPYNVGVFDPAASTFNTTTVTNDVFCGGNCILPNGNVLLSGGTLAYPQNTPNGRWWGGNWMSEYDFTSNTFMQRNPMAHGRWYPTQILLPNGTVLIVSGFDEFGCTNGLVEVYDPSSQSLSVKYDPLGNKMYCVGACTTVPGAGSPCYGGAGQGTVPSISYYPRMHVMPNGLVACVGMKQPLKTWNPVSGHWVLGGNFAVGHDRVYGSSVLLPLQNTTTETGRILSIGGAPDFPDPATNQCEIVIPNGSSLQTQLISPMQYSRWYLSATILPTGSIFVNGGATQGDADTSSVYAAEMFDPLTQTWTTLPSAQVGRRYHSVSLLLPDGRVWTAGTTIGLSPPGELRTEIYSPAYVSATRPSITGAPVISGGYGGTIAILTPDAPDISSVSLVKVSAVTHHFNFDQRLVWLQIQNKSPGSVTVAAPINGNIAPPGYYLVFILNADGVPSVGQLIKIPS